mmetsp:Transcript_34510/g.50522  ORF Transcript_34510/g.50522 Transcript_34510/m.50522 type:complete len:88 (-) Transcript_34510:557-820(-)
MHIRAFLCHATKVVCLCVCFPSKEKYFIFHSPSIPSYITPHTHTHTHIHQTIHIIHCTKKTRIHKSSCGEMPSLQAVEQQRPPQKQH